MEVILNRGENSSHSTEINYVARDGSLYVIDNHLTALWCWAKLPANEQYNLLHVDRHYDLVTYTGHDAEALDVDWPNIPVEQITTYRHEIQGFDYQVLRWDNYINLFHEIYPGRIADTVFVTQKEGHLNYDGKPFVEKDVWDLFNHIFDGNNRWIFNIDIDYFFTVIGEDRILLYSYDFIDAFGELLAREAEHAAQIIICLSPECCGGWEESKKVANRILTYFDISI